MTERRASPEEATQQFLDRLKRTNPSDAVRVAIDEIEGEMRRQAESRPMKHRSGSKAATTRMAGAGR
jgi:hypothetical protein